MNERWLGPALAFDRVGHRYGDHVALDAVSFSCAPGEFIALLGASGSGKTTLLRGAAGLLAFDQGEVRSAGRGDRRAIAMVFQSHVLIDRLSALDNVLAGRLGYNPRWRGWLRRFTREDRLLAFDCLDQVSLLAHAGRRVDTMSGGERQRIALARALAQQPAVLLADEPGASLDPAAGATLRLLRDCCRERQTAVVCSLHQPALALEYADRVVGLRSGQVVLDAPASDLDATALAAVYR